MPEAPFAEVIPAAEIATRVAELGEALTVDYAGREPVFVAVLTGALWFVADLIRMVDLPAEVDFLGLNRFGEGGRIRIAVDTAVPLTGRDVVIVEDIVDTGLSLGVLRTLLLEREPASLRTVTLIDKVSRRLRDVPLEYRGFEVGDEFLVGYGLDYEGRYRNLPGIWAVFDLAAFARDPDLLAREVFGSR